MLANRMKSSSLVATSPTGEPWLAAHVAGAAKPRRRAGRTLSRRVSLVLAGLCLALACKKQAPVVEQVAEAPVHVDAVDVTPLKVPRTLRLTGTLRGAKETDLAANVAGRVLKTLVERGARVEKGALLAQVDVRAAALALAEARVQVETSKTQQAISTSDCDRYEKLKATGAVTPFEYDQVTAKCKTAPLNILAAEARQSSAAKNVGDGVIRAPFSGVVTERYIEVGEYVQAASRVVSLAQVDELRLEFSLPEQNWPDLKQGALVAFRVAAYGDRVFNGKVSHMSGAVRETRDVVVEALVPNPDHQLLPGMFASVELSIGQEELPSVPRSAVFQQNGKQNVLVVAGAALEQRVLQPAPEIDGRVPVRRGVSVGEKVVAVHLDSLKNGQRVN